jgi:hypothetical protein
VLNNLSQVTLSSTAHKSKSQRTRYQNYLNIRRESCPNSLSLRYEVTLYLCTNSNMFCVDTCVFLNINDCDISYIQLNLVYYHLQTIWTIFLHIYILTYLLTPWSRVLLEKITGFQPVKKFSIIYGTWRFTTALTTACHLSLHWARSIQSRPPSPLPEDPS